MSKATVAVYACGGAATNILKKLPVEPGEGMAELKRYFIDTSNSNMRNSNINAEEVFLFEGVDGSGKVRSENHDLISKNTLKILQDFKPTTFSVVTHSASGGSGAIIGGSLVAELKKRGEQVVVILIGSTNSQIEIENTLKTLKSYDAIADKSNSPVVVHYLENSAEHSRSSIDSAATRALFALLALFSGENDELDTADLRNWMKHSKLRNELVSLHFCMSDEAYQAAGTVVTVATLAKHDSNTALSPLPAYQAVGFVAGLGDSSFIGDEPIHFTISSDLITTSAKALNAKLKESDARLNSSVRRESLVDRHDNQTDSGIIL